MFYPLGETQKYLKGVWNPLPPVRHILERFEKKEGKTAKSKYSRTWLINNLLAIYG